MTGDQRVTSAMESNNPQDTDILIRTMMDNGTPEEVDFPADLRNIKKPKSFNKRKGDKSGKKSAPEYREPIRI